MLFLWMSLLNRTREKIMHVFHAYDLISFFFFKLGRIFWKFIFCTQHWQHCLWRKKKVVFYIYYVHSSILCTQLTLSILSILKMEMTSPVSLYASQNNHQNSLFFPNSIITTDEKKNNWIMNIHRTHSTHIVCNRVQWLCMSCCLYF